MRQISFIILSVIMISCSEPTVQSSAIDLTGYETRVLGDVTIATKMNDHAELIEKGYLKNGVKNGPWMSYYPDKKRIKTMTTFVDGAMTGPHLEFSNRGQIEKKINYIGNNYDGIFATYKNGRTVKEMEYNNGVLTGEYKEYDSRGNLQKLTNFKDGKPHGKMIFYDEGAVVMEYEYQNGEKVSGGIVEKQATEEEGE